MNMLVKSRQTANRLLLSIAAVVVTSLPSQATPPVFHILIESASPYFLPPSAKINAGEPIRWDNPTPSHHTVTHDGCIGEGPCAFDSGSLRPDDSYSLPGLPPGRYSYHCQLHPIMRGILMVAEPAASSSQT
jgi:plastocyanin